MNNQEAKFILGAYRPDGRDTPDPMFAGALAHAEHDPELRAWLEQQRKFDAVVSTRLRQIVPPAELREAILAGVRVSRPRRHWWNNPSWLAAAAAIALIATVSFRLVRAGASPSISDLRAFAVQDLAAAHDNHIGFPSEFAGLQAQLSASMMPLTSAGGVAIDLDELRRKNCRSVTIAGREVFELCFQRDGTWFHLYAARRSDFASGPVDPKSLIAESGEYSAAAWVDAKNVYALVTHAGKEVLRRVI
jgi:hypothetical protein